MHSKIQSIVLVLLALFVVPIFYISLAASIDMNYEAFGITFSEAYERARTASISSVMRDDFAKVFFWFIPFALLISLGFTLFRERMISNYLLVAAIIVPALLCPFSMVVAFRLPIYLLSPHDGETWGEAWPALSAIGFWVFVAAILGIYRFRTWDRISVAQHSG